MITNVIKIYLIMGFSCSIFAANYCKNECEATCRDFFIDEEGDKKLQSTPFWDCVNSCMDRKCPDYSN